MVVTGNRRELGRGAREDRQPMRGLPQAAKPWPRSVSGDISRCPTWLVAGACRFTGLNAVLKKLHFREPVGFGRACPPFRTTTCSLGGLQVAQAARAITAQWNG